MEQTELHEEFTGGKSTLKVFNAQLAETHHFLCASIYMSMLRITLLTDTFLSFPIIQIPSPLLMKN